jgi:hypothetical protein
MRRFSFLIVVLLPVCLLAYTGYMIFSECSATPANNKVTISWVTKSEQGVSKFKIVRSTSIDGLYGEIGSVMAKGLGSNYTFTDTNVIFKDSQTFFYKIHAVNSNNAVVEESGSLLVNPNISGIFRTWGAIKAIFR